MRVGKGSMAVVITLVAGAITIAGTARAGNFNMPRGRWWENPRVIREVGLTPGQREQIHRTVYRYAEAMIGLNADVRKAELRLVELARREPFDEGAVRKAWAGYQAARHKLENERFELLIAIRKLLTAEQWQELDGLRRQFQQRRRMPGRTQPGRNPYRPPEGQQPPPPPPDGGPPPPPPPPPDGGPPPVR